MQFATARGYEELRVLRSSAAPRTASYELRLGGAFAEARLVGGKVQVVDEGGQVVVESPAARAWDLDGAEVAVELALSGAGPKTWTLAVSMVPGSARYPVIVDPAWEYVGPIPAASVFTAQGRSTNLLPDGRVLIAGGLGYDLTAAEFITPTPFSSTRRVVRSRRGRTCRVLAGITWPPRLVQRAWSSPEAPRRASSRQMHRSRVSCSTNPPPTPS